MSNDFVSYRFNREEFITIDKKLVFCKCCKFWAKGYPDTPENLGFCVLHAAGSRTDKVTGPDDFCSFGSPNTDTSPSIRVDIVRGSNS